MGGVPLSVGAVCVYPERVPDALESMNNINCQVINWLIKMLQLAPPPTDPDSFGCCRFSGWTDTVRSKARRDKESRTIRSYRNRHCNIPYTRTQIRLAAPVRGSKGVQGSMRGGGPLENNIGNGSSWHINKCVQGQHSVHDGRLRFHQNINR